MFVLILPIGTTRACSTPTWLYMLQRISRNPYIILYFYRNKEHKKDIQVNEFIESFSKGERGNANINFLRIDISEISKEGGNDFIKTLYERHAKEELPFYLIITSCFNEIYSGDINIEMFKSLIESSKRNEIEKKLCDGKHGLLLVLLSQNEKENGRTLETVKKVLNSYKDVGLLTLDRNNSDEKWLVRQLLSVEVGLEEVKNTMVFGILGRGYALPPYIGEDITKESISGVIEFMEGACSCYLSQAIYYRGSNVGMYLLTNSDWQAGSKVYMDEYAYYENSYPEVNENISKSNDVEDLEEIVQKETNPKPKSAFKDTKDQNSSKTKFQKMNLVQKEENKKQVNVSKDSVNSIRNSSFEAPFSTDYTSPFRLTLFVGGGMFLLILASGLFILLRKGK